MVVVSEKGNGKGEVTSDMGWPLVSKKMQSHFQRKCCSCVHMVVNNVEMKIGFASNFAAPVTVELTRSEEGGSFNSGQGERGRAGGVVQARFAKTSGRDTHLAGGNGSSRFGT